jgi:hypothetical protein
MATKKISQREARELKKRVEQLESEENRRRARWATTYPGGVHLMKFRAPPEFTVQITTARKLGHAVVVLEDDHGNLNFYALPMAKGST